MAPKLRLLGLAAFVLATGPLVRPLAAQDDKIYPVNEVSNPPRLSSSEEAAKLILQSYPEDLRRRRVGGIVELQFVVDEQGKVDASTVEIVDATQTALGQAAKKVVPKLTFVAGKLNGTCVKTRVTLPIVYKATAAS